MSLIVINKDILDIQEGVICQQVNCKNAYGRGLSGVIAKKYPEVELAYHNSFNEHTSEELFGTVGYIYITQRLTVANIYSQFEYGNSAKTHKCYTDMDKLIDGVFKALRYAQNLGENLYIPYRIGCGLAGGDWHEFCHTLNYVLDNQPIYVCAREQDIPKGVDIISETIV